MQCLRYEYLHTRVESTFFLKQTPVRYRRHSNGPTLPRLDFITRMTSIARYREGATLANDTTLRSVTNELVHILLRKALAFFCRTCIPEIVKCQLLHIATNIKQNVR